MNDFNQFNLPAELNASLERMKFTAPTPIQEQAIPLALAGHDILGSAQTGTGKTAAFAIPLVVKLLANPNDSALVLTPTRELALQVIKVIEQLLNNSGHIKTALLIGGDSMFKQLQQLRMRPRVVVGTPGRINDHLERGTLKLISTKMLVLDETDRMLDMGFGVQLERIARHLPPIRQTLMFSATLPQAIVKMSERYLQNPKRIAVGQTNTAVPQVKQEVVRINEADKYQELLKELASREGSILVFVKTKYGAEKLADKLYRQQHSADAIHGDLQQRQRERVIAGFRNKKFRILVATDIAARGLDIPHIEHVINFDIPHCPEDYIHRIGRTARAGAVGSALSFICQDDVKRWRAIERLLNPQAESERRSNGRNGQQRRGNNPGYQGDRRRRFRGGRSDHHQQASY